MVRKKQATIRAAAKHKQNRREQLARARKHRKVEQFDCTDAELQQQYGVVADEPLSCVMLLHVTLFLVEKLGPSSKKNLLK